MAAEKERKVFKTNILQYPYDIRLEAAAVAYRSADNKFTQAQLADRHVIGITSLKNKIAALKKNDNKARQDAMVAGVAVAEVLMQGSVLNLEATNEAHLSYIETRAQAAKAVHEKQKAVDELKRNRTSVRVEKRKVLFVFDFHFHVPEFLFFLQRKETDAQLKTAERELNTSKKHLSSRDSAFFTATFGGVARPAVVGRPAEFEERTIQAVIDHFNRIQTNIKNGVSHAALFMNVNLSIIPFLWKMFKCKHCNSSYASIRTARNHDIICPAVKDSQLACREFSGCACDSCFDAPSQPIAFVQMAPMLPPGESDSASSESAFERATSFGKKATMLFTHVRFCSEIADSDSNAAWQVMTELQDIAENCCSMAAVLVHRNKSDSGLKKNHSSHSGECIPPMSPAWNCF